MKRIQVLILTTLTIFLMNMTAPEVSSGIQFNKGKFSAAKAEAKRTNKTIFIDAYTVWCGPCKKMAKEVFTKEEVGTFFNKNFINLKMDMEKTDGMLVSRRYNVNFYPTLLFITPEGSLIRKEVGFHNKEQLMRVARDVVANQ